MSEYFQSKCWGVYCFMYSSVIWVMNSVHPQMAAVIQDRIAIQVNVLYFNPGQSIIDPESLL